MASVSFNAVEKNFGAVKVIHGISFDIADGEFLVLVGPSGCGKSTLLRMLAGLEEISGGVVAIDGKKVNDVDSKDRDIAMVFQSYALYPHMSVRDNMGFSLKLRKADAKLTTERVARAAQILNLEPYLDRYPRELSGGQRQRVAMGRAIVRDPKVFLFDEPLSNLDAKLRVAMRAEIKALHQRLKTTTVYVTHDQIEAMTMADRIVVMHDGVIEQIGTPLELYDHPDNLFVAQFIGSPAMNIVRGTVRRDRRQRARGNGRRRALAARRDAGGRWPGGRLWHPPRASRAGGGRRRSGRTRRSHGRRAHRRRNRIAGESGRCADRARHARAHVGAPGRPHRPYARSGDRARVRCRKRTARGMSRRHCVHAVSCALGAAGPRRLPDACRAARATASRRP